MTWKLANGVLFVGGVRVVLRHVVSYKGSEQTVILNAATRTESLHSADQTGAIIEALDAHFQKMGYQP